MRIKPVTHLVATLLMSALALTACSNTPEEDPLESMNRGVFAFNKLVDQNIIGPVAKGYRYITPDPLRERIGNFSDNLREPVSMLNAFLQGDMEQGLTSFWRFVINTTVGFAGINDVASEAGLKERREDFGQTLGYYGIGNGPYIVLPILGPSSGRDTVGMVADWFSNPTNYVVEDEWAQFGIAAGQALVERERLIDPIDDIYENSLDPYVTFRSIYYQHRKAQVENRNSNFDKSNQSPEEYEDNN